MASLNKVFLAGNLTRNPELRYTNSGSAVCELGLAVNRRWVTNGEQKEETCFLDIDVWGKQAESCSRYLQKGSPALVEGRLRMNQWQDRDTGQNRSKIVVVAERVQFLGRPPSREGFSQEASSPGGEGPAGPPRGQERQRSEPPSQSGPPTMPDNRDVYDVDNNETDDDIPF